MRKGRKSLKKLRLYNDLKRSLDGEAFVRDVIGGRNVYRDGAEIRHSCPLPFGLHKTGDENPSASFNEEKLVFHCFVCGGGDIFWYVQNVRDCNLEEALGILREIVSPSDITAAELIAEFEAMWQEEATNFQMPDYSPRILEPWKMYSVYLDERGISREVQKSYQTGVDLRNKDKVMVKTPDGKVEKWLEQPRLVIPHFFEGNLVGWSKRLLDAEQKGPKYKHAPGFPKNNTLFNWDVARTRNTAIVVESPMSVLKMASHGVLNGVATFGANVTDEQVFLLRQFDEVVLAFDGDYAGHNANVEVFDRVHQFASVTVMKLEEGKDPGDLSKGELESLVKNREPAAIAL